MIERGQVLLYVTFLLLGAAVGIGGLALTNRARPAPIVIATPQPTVTAVPTPTPLPTATPGPITVHVSGAVAAPGVYEVAAGSVVQTAVRAAGGFTDAANIDLINLAQPVIHGAQIYVATLVENPQTPAAVVNPPVSSSVDGEAAKAEPGALININLANAADLETLPGVGPSTAAAIVQFRTEQGNFVTIEDLLQVSGIGPAKFAQMEPFITVGN